MPGMSLSTLHENFRLQLSFCQRETLKKTPSRLRLSTGPGPGLLENRIFKTHPAQRYTAMIQNLDDYLNSNYLPSPSDLPPLRIS